MAISSKHVLRHYISGENIPTCEGPLHVSCSLGVACAAMNEGAAALIARADAALCRAKANGRNRTEVAGESTVTSV